MEMAVFVTGIMILGLFGVLWAKSKDREGDIFWRMGGFLYDVLNEYRFPFMEVREVQNNLEGLYPGEKAEELNRAYYVEKLRLVLLILLVGMLFCLAVQIKYWAENVQIEEFTRPPAGGEAYEVLLEAKVGEEREEVWVEVTEQKLLPEAVEVLLEDCICELKLLLADRHEQEMGTVEGQELPEMLEGYPFEILWRSGSTGELTAYFYYGEDMYTHTFYVETAMGEENTTLAAGLQEAIVSQDVKTRYEEQLVLPSGVGGREIIWKEVKENYSGVFLLLTLVAAVGVFFLKDKDLHEEWLQRKRNMQLSYPIILNKFVLYMGAGLTVRGSFVKIATDAGSREAGNISVAYEEMLYSCNELHAGVSESLVYERFGRRSGLQEYARLATMLSQNLKKGNATLLDRLREESEKAQEENLQLKKKLGEEAQTKLLVPMIMMMAIVMLLVMLPAFLSF